MVNFIVCEDNKIILQKNIDIINKTMFENNIDYRIYPFSNYSEELNKIILSNIENKIYILDIELEDISGIDIARNIRDIDLNSLIIISTTHTEYLPYTLKSKLMIFDYVSKFEDYESNLSKIIIKGIESLNINKYIKIQINNKNLKILLKDIYFIKYDHIKKYTVVKTKDNYYKTHTPFKILIKNLDYRFYKKNDMYYINKQNKKFLVKQSKKERSVNK